MTSWPQGISQHPKWYHLIRADLRQINHPDSSWLPWQPPIWDIWCIHYIPRIMLTIFTLLCFVVIGSWLFLPTILGLLQWLWDIHSIAQAPVSISGGYGWPGQVDRLTLIIAQQNMAKRCAYIMGYITVSPQCYNTYTGRKYRIFSEFYLTTRPPVPDG